MQMPRDGICYRSINDQQAQGEDSRESDEVWMIRENDATESVTNLLMMHNQGEDSRESDRLWVLRENDETESIMDLANDDQDQREDSRESKGLS